MIALDFNRVPTSVSYLCDHFLRVHVHPALSDQESAFLQENVLPLESVSLTLQHRSPNTG
jgi:hypothetical protein